MPFVNATGPPGHCNCCSQPHTQEFYHALKNLTNPKHRNGKGLRSGLGLQSRNHCSFLAFASTSAQPQLLHLQQELGQNTRVQAKSSVGLSQDLLRLLPPGAKLAASSASHSHYQGPGTLKSTQMPVHSPPSHGSLTNCGDRGAVCMCVTQI